MGSAFINALQPNTLYSFNLTCVGTDKTVTLNIRTDFGRPLAPQNITVRLNSKRLRIAWSSPFLPAGPISNYKLTIDQQSPIENISNSQLSYDMTEDYVFGQKHEFFLEACNKNRKNDSLCSNPTYGRTIFFMPMPITPAQNTSTSENGSNTLFFSKFFPFFIFSFLLLN
ncbi:unnamed protein product [Rotaria sp. Silwood2]|nr:unnamed protein product [Rotaria sp. Silwood2]